MHRSTQGPYVLHYALNSDQSSLIRESEVKVRGPELLQDPCIKSRNNLRIL